MTNTILIVGRGTAGTALARDIARKSDAVVVGFLDDFSAETDVLGPLSDVNRVIAQYKVDLVYFAIPSVAAKTIRDFLGTITRANVDIAVIPRTYEILTKETVNIDDLTDVDVLDLVGREPVKHDLLSSREFIAGKRILVTGAAGSIGSRLVRQIAAMGAAEVVCVDWWENGIFYLREDLAGQDNLKYHIADVKNEALLDRLFAQYTPDVVFHAAAYKHVPLMQDNPIEAINNNVWGTLNLMQLAIAHGTEHFIMVSTDKAVNPVNVMGATKRLGEMMMESLARTTTTTRFNAVRFGNVIQSNGSVMQTFRKQIAAKQPLTVTHKDITRFFMTIDEASQLIIQSAFAGQSSDIFVLDMGEPVRILDLAQSLVNAIDPTLGINIVGLRPGEKMFEELSYDPHRVSRTPNNKIFVVRDESDFDTTRFMEELRGLVAATRSYSLTDAEAIDRLRAMGFAVQMTTDSHASAGIAGHQ
ncbi:SDR family oxidoreductase [Glaciihabitans tibetensis]|uniref:SDR family oxidoreductase n=1 Tax=Glaciihabitans tibetensis TaxID=1266600 RepID=UPI0011B1DDF5|nr:polysaccharide biosynthesis protein [Glaciihabitans tibetensis]